MEVAVRVDLDQEFPIEAGDLLTRFSTLPIPERPPGSVLLLVVDEQGHYVYVLCTIDFLSGISRQMKGVVLDQLLDVLA